MSKLISTTGCLYHFRLTMNLICNRLLFIFDANAIISSRVFPLHSIPGFPCFPSHHPNAELSCLFFLSTCSAGPIQYVVYSNQDPKNGPTHVITSCNHATNRSLHADIESKERFWRLKMKPAVICSPHSPHPFTQHNTTL